MNAKLLCGGWVGIVNAKLLCGGWVGIVNAKLPAEDGSAS